MMDSNVHVDHAEHTNETILLTHSLDITSDNISLAGLAQHLDDRAEGDFKAILDGGAVPRDVIAEFDAKLSAAEVEAINDYVAENDNFLALRDEIHECDDVLGTIESLLGRYASDLATISTDIRSLQEQSQAMNVKLRNRRALQGGLSDFVERVALLPSLINAIMKAPVASDAFSAALDQLVEKLSFVASDESVRLSAAFRDVAPELERLRLAAVTRSRSLLLDQIYGLRRPRAHIQAKQVALLRHRAAASFLRAHGGDIYTEVRAAYAEKVSGKLLDIFKSYWGAMERVEATVATADDVLGAPETSSLVASIGGSNTAGNRSSSSSSTVAGMFSSALSSFGGGGGGGGGGGLLQSSPSPSPLRPNTSGTTINRTPPPVSDVFALGDRATVLSTIDSAPIILHEAAASGRTFPFEVLFRSLSKLLMDTSSHEYLFCRDFWGEGGKAAFKESFSPITTFIQASLATALHDIHDPVALLLCIRINREYSLALARRAIPALDDHFDALNLLLWPRLKSALDVQLDSLKLISPSDSVNGDVQPTRVHIVTRRYAALTATVLALHADFLDGPLSHTIERLRYSVMNLLLTLSRGFPQRGRGTVFLIHNFSHVIGVLKDAAARPLPTSAAGAMAAAPPLTSTLTPTPLELNSTKGSTTTVAAPGLGPAGEEVLTAFEESVSRATGLYVEARLTAGAPQLVAFVKRGEAAAAHTPEGAVVAGFGPTEAAPVARDFSGRWERIVEVLNGEIARDFGQSGAGRAVQQAAFTQLLLHWSRFLELLKRQGEAGSEVARGAVSMPSIMYALKQHRLKG